MTLIKIEFKDGTVKEFKHEGRAGGSWTKTLKTEPGWVIVRGEYGETWQYPSDTVKSVETRE